MSTNQTAMDVIGNNIANANTIGYKNSRVDFNDAVYQAGMAPHNSPNGQQVGTGASVAATPTMFTQGAFQSTGSATDLAINGGSISSGGGFFVISPNADSGSGAQLTRAGNFSENSAGYLTTADGYYVMGSTSPFSKATTPTSLQGLQIPGTITSTGETVSSFTVGTDGTVTAVGQNGGTQTVGYLGIAAYANPQGLTSLGNNRYAYAPAAGSADAVNSGGQGIAGTVQQGSLEESNVNLSSEFSNMITTERGFDANSKSITAANEMLKTDVTLKQ
jgi:flagellar hook protein FlgE